MKHIPFIHARFSHGSCILTSLLPSSVASKIKINEQLFIVSEICIRIRRLFVDITTVISPQTHYRICPVPSGNATPTCRVCKQTEFSSNVERQLRYRLSNAKHYFWSKSLFYNPQWGAECIP